MIIHAARSVGSFARAGLVVAALAAAFLVIGCSASPAAPEIRSGAFVGPDLALVEHEDRHAVVLRADRPGWTVRLDRVEEQFGYDRIFVSLRRPHPMAPMANPQAEQRALTNAPATRIVEVYARELAHDAPFDAEDPYALAVPRNSAR
ncbi:MAG: hypothetical protein IPM33_09060 [Phycisphaerales bacterium]|nr:hypothetical protein [Phycisphaerales bacterium]